MHLSVMQIFLWTFGIAFFGVFFAVPLRKEIIVREQLTFPSGTATAEMIAVLNKQDVSSFQQHRIVEEATDGTGEHDDVTEAAGNAQRWGILAKTFALSGAYELIAYFVPIIKSIPVFGAVTAPSWGWYLTPSASYVGQGMIMGFRVACSQMAGALVGWVVLGPIVKRQGWVDSTIMDAKDGVKGWLIWFSLAIIFAESIVSLLLLIVEVVHIWLQKRQSAWYPWPAASRVSQPHKQKNFRETSFDDDVRPLSSDSDTDPSYNTFGNKASFKDNMSQDDGDFATPSQQVPVVVWGSGLVLSALMCVGLSTWIFDIDVWEPLIAVVASLLVSVIAIRALGQTDLNPVSGVGKLAQLLFSGVAPGNVVANLVAGGIAEAGAQQAGSPFVRFTSHHFQASLQAT